MKRRRTGPISMLILVFLIASCDRSSSRYSIDFSKLNDRSFPTNLQGQSVAEDIYAFVKPESGVKQVLFYIDDPRRSGAPASVEKDAPFDLAGGPVAAANPYDTRKLSDGRHTLTAAISEVSGGTAAVTTTVTASFDVRNHTPANQAAYWGITTEGVPWDMNRLDEWESLVGKAPSIVQFWLPWSEQGQLAPLQADLLENVRSHGAIPMITWLPQRMSFGVSQPNYQLSKIINGQYDPFLRQWATDARKWGGPFFLRWGHEMNGNWFPWGEDANGNKRGEFVQAWKHIVDIFRSAGAHNVTWVWCPNIDWSGSGWPTMKELYPGDNYVDWTCLDGYNWGPDKGGWKSFDEIFRWSYENIRSIAPGKPVMIGEFASSERGGSKAGWIRDTFGTQIPFNYPGVRAVVWYNYLTDQDWRIESSPESVDAFKASISSPYYASNTLGNLSVKPIPAP